MTPVLELIRLENNLEHGMFGCLKLNKRVFCVTLELPDRQNVPYVSCIPAGQYTCVKKWAKFGETFRVMDVPNRDHILFHAGNIVEETEGCILLAQYWGKLAGNRAVLNSGRTFKNFMAALAGKDPAAPAVGRLRRGDDRGPARRRRSGLARRPAARGPCRELGPGLWDLPVEDGLALGAGAPLPPPGDRSAGLDGGGLAASFRRFSFWAISSGGRSPMHCSAY